MYVFWGRLSGLIQGQLTIPKEVGLGVVVLLLDVGAGIGLHNVTSLFRHAIIVALVCAYKLIKKSYNNLHKKLNYIQC